MHNKKHTFTDWLHDTTNPVTYCLLTLDGKDFLTKNSYEVELHQKAEGHDSFTIMTPDDSLDSFEGFVLENSRRLLGKRVTITYWRYGEIRQTFSGIIGNIRNRKNDGGGYGKLFITGYSPDILLDNGKECRSFEDKTLEQIIKEVNEGHPEEGKVRVDRPINKDTIPYTVQYKESDYDFIKRLAKRYGEYFYYTGQEIIFGTKVQPRILLEENMDLVYIELEMKIGPQEFAFMGYDSQRGEKVENQSKGIQTEFKENLFQGIARARSEDVYTKKSKMHYNHAGIHYNTRRELEEVMRIEKEKNEDLMRVKGKSRDPELKIGGRAKILDINSKPMETYRIIEISHYHDGNRYYNEFVGVPDLFYCPNIDIEAVPKGEEQPARVVDNNDPLKMGRIRVQFPWQEDKNQKTPWIRMLQPYAGADKGFYLIPEIGEEVMVGFEGGNAEKPYVMGTHYNGSEISSYHTACNDLKVIKTRSGCKIVINDAEGSVLIEDPSGNTWLMDGQGNIHVNAPKNFTVNAGENITMTAGKDVSVSAGNDMSNSAENNITQTAGNDLLQTAEGDMVDNSNSKTEIARDEIHRETKNMNSIADEISIFSIKENMTLQSGKTVEVNSAEKSNLF